ncbi:hypothetical protein [Halorussus halobius]|uniref:hypothetical protein n=1 Tax=Halorussus halobius TaxID=1710537 RepID=UPI001B2FE47C|nr:hypothetical protein [Halorussus halobius]
MFRKLRDHDGTPVVALDKDELDMDGVLTEDGEVPDGKQVHLSRVGEGSYLVREVTDDGLADLSEVFQ